MSQPRNLEPEHLGEIAIIGMAGRFPGASDLEEFWRNLRAGVESITFFTDGELAEAGVAPAFLARPDYVKARPFLAGADLFDSSFFGFSPREASLMDPQHRIFLECSWQALEAAGYDAARYPGAIGVFGGSSFSTYLINLFSNPELVELVGLRQALLGNDKDYLATRVSYKLGLRGPSLSVQTACSTALVAVHLACQSLINNECAMALAGGVTIGVPQTEGYLYQEEGIASPDGHCRAFDARAQGTIGGDGVGIVVLKRMSEALADGDTIRAVIKGSAINNDGSLKMSYTAPSVQAQAQVVAEALAVAGVRPETVSYVEAHGTGTSLGDPIEIAALTRAFRAGTEERGFCAVGSVKTNVGHLDAAAGIAGLIKTVLALENRELPASLHFEAPNPRIDFAASPFFVNAALREWPDGRGVRRAGVSSMGIGGTNAHLVLEEAPPPAPLTAGDPWQLLLISARTEGALETATAELADHLEHHPNLDLADVAFTSQVGRREFPHRRTVLCETSREAAALLRTGDPQRVSTTHYSGEKRPVAFLFPGQGSQHVGMGRELYRYRKVFRREIDLCAELLRPALGLDLRQILFPAEGEEGKAAELLGQTANAQPALFAIEYATARLWMDLGIEPQAMIGHSVGELVAACLAEVFTLEAALALVAARGRLMQGLPVGTMLAVPLGEEELRGLLVDGLAVAAVNGPALTVVSGEPAAVAGLEASLAARGLECRRLHTSHAFHSAMMDPILDEFARRVEAARPRAPKRPYVSNLTGTWVTAEEATDPGYWVAHLRRTVRFADGLAQLLAEPGLVLLEVGPGEALSTLARRHPDIAAGQVAIASMQSARDQSSDLAHLLRAAGRLWLAGVRLDWPRLHSGRRRRVPLPTYPFERERHWVERRQGSLALRVELADDGRREVADWFYLPVFRPAPSAPSSTPVGREMWLVFLDDLGLGAGAAERLAGDGHTVLTVTPGERFKRLGPTAFTVDPGRREDYSALLAEVRSLGLPLDQVLHLWGVVPAAGALDAEAFETAQDRGFYSLLFLGQALAERAMPPKLGIGIVTHGLLAVTDEEEIRPERATVLALAKVLPQEYPGLVCRSLDLALPGKEPRRIERAVEQILRELRGGASDLVVAFRGAQRWVETFEPVHLGPMSLAQWLPPGGVYLIVGGFGRLGQVIARQIARGAPGARVVLCGRRDLPLRAAWQEHCQGADAQDEVARRIRQVLALEELGAEVLPRTVDVADLAAMTELVEELCHRFGRICGVVHAAGDVGEDHRSIQELTREECAAQFQAKVRGALVLEAALRDRAPDFCVLFSSLSTVLGGLGLAAYSAANLFLDGLARDHARRTGERWISVGWDAWRLDRGGERPAAGSVREEMAIEAEEGGDAFARILVGIGGPQVVVSTTSLEGRLARWILLESLHRAPGERQASALHARGSLATPYVAPRNELEAALATVWQDLLGIEQVGVHDNFFELGGHSLLAIQLKSRLRSAFEFEPPLRTLFEKPTIAELAEAIEAQLVEGLENLSDEEVERLLEAES